MEIYFSLKENERSLHEKLLYYCGRDYGGVVDLRIGETYVKVESWKLKVAGFVIEGCDLHPQKVGGPMIVDYIGLTDRHFSVKHEISAQEELLAKLRGKIGLPPKRPREEWVERAMDKFYPERVDKSSKHHTTPSKKPRSHVNVGTIGHTDFSNRLNRAVSGKHPRGFALDIEANMFPLSPVVLREEGDTMTDESWAKFEEITRKNLVVVKEAVFGTEHTKPIPSPFVGGSCLLNLPKGSGKTVK